MVIGPDGLRDAGSGEVLAADAGAATRITVNNRLRRAIGTARAALALSAPDPAQRLAAANTLRENASPALLPALDARARRRAGRRGARGAALRHRQSRARRA